MTHENESDGDAQPEISSSGKQRRVAKTLLETSIPEGIDFAIPEAVAAEAEAEVEADEALREEQRLYDERMAALAKQRSQRRVAKTLLFNKADLAGAVQNAAAAAAAAQPVAETSAVPAQTETASAATPAPTPVKRKKTRRIAKTLQEGKEEPLAPQAPRHGITDELADAVVAASNPGANSTKSKTQYPRVRQQYIARTMLDHSVLWQTVSKFEAKMEEKVAEQILSRAHEPVKPFVAIECKKTALPCGWRWDDPETKQRFRYCELCKTPVYNFNGLELPEAEEIIYQRENKRNATLYKRADGKFMTVNCPVQVKRKRDMALLIVAAVLLAAGSIAFMVLMPRPPKPAQQAEAPGATTGPTITDLRKSGPGVNRGTNTSGSITVPATGSTPGGAAASGDGSFRMINGQRVDTPPQPGATATFPAPAQPVGTTDSDESGEFWQYSGDQAGKSDAPAPVITPPAQQP